MASPSPCMLPLAFLVSLSLLIPTTLGASNISTLLLDCIYSFICICLCFVFLFRDIFDMLAGVICEDLPQELCAFAISSSSRRCILESSYQASGKPAEYQCRTSEVVVKRMKDHIETDQCVKACGVDRNSVGISSDSLLEPQFVGKLCSPECHLNCPNILDLYFNLAAGEGKNYCQGLLLLFLFF